MALWRPNGKDRPVEVVERVEPVEIPIITETKRRLARGEYAPALQAAYGQVVADLQKAFGRPFPAGWTNQEILDRGAGESWGHVPDFFRRLTDLYTPLRFGAPAPATEPETLLSLLQSIYAAPPMWRLYLQPKHIPPASIRAPDVTAPHTADGPESRRSDL